MERNEGEKGEGNERGRGRGDLSTLAPEGASLSMKVVGDLVLIGLTLIIYVMLIQMLTDVFPRF